MHSLLANYEQMNEIEKKIININKNYYRPLKILMMMMMMTQCNQETRKFLIKNKITHNKFSTKLH